MPTIGKYGLVILSPEEIKYIHDNWETKTNPQLAEELGLKLTRLRYFLSEMGLKRMELEYWTKEQVKYLLDNYKSIGDVELAEIFNSKWKKNKGWTKKHIEKKRRYLKLKRTPEEKETIFLRNVQAGRFRICNQKRWEKTGSNPIGTIVFWRQGEMRFPAIKTENGYVHYYRWLYVQKHGPITSDELVVPKKEAPRSQLLTVDQLEIIDRAEHAIRNHEIRMAVPEELREIIRLKNKIIKTINKKTND